MRMKDNGCYDREGVAHCVVFFRPIATSRICTLKFHTIKQH